MRTQPTSADAGCCVFRSYTPDRARWRQFQRHRWHHAVTTEERLAHRLRSRHDLICVAQHLCFEFLSMREAVAILRTSPSGPVYRLALENFLLHTRNLLNTFYENRPLPQMQEDDLLARDFFVPPATWEAVRPELPPALAQNRERLNKLLAHLTYSRIGYALHDPPEWRWPYDLMAGELEEVMLAFTANVPAEHRDFFTWAVAP